MSDPEYLDHVIRLLKGNHCRNELLDSASRIDQLEIDSIHLARFLLDLEKELEVMIPDEAWVKWVCVADIVEYIEKFKVDFGNGRLSEM